MHEQEGRDLQESPGTEEQTGNPDADVGEESVPDDEPAVGSSGDEALTQERSSGLG